MNTLEVAKTALDNGEFTFVVAYQGKVVFTSQENGVKPFLVFYQQHGEAFQGGALADRVVGKAMALLLQLAKIERVYAQTISEPAIAELQRAGIETEWENRVPYVLNRDGSGLCPMEQLAKDVKTPEEMLTQVQSFFQNRS